ncbi:hypothetical protein DEIPH_ctg050orf0020 [Deinococcus phoenicis]|uniref:Uncharacterized protein n=1 Tax=Deinococcus phoenicis TaxID=1476583 RepID=A0A016QMF5_9DEIO|nr:hypothetical protein DEIPH_ctg050orf0020 [Deinococcus phoenicis]
MGFRLLRDEGEQALTLERLCAEMKLTRGSFYHHFGMMADYRQALLHGWQDDLTGAVIQQLPDGGSGVDSPKELGERVARLDHRLDLAFRVWSLRDPEVKAVMDEVDARRLAALTELHRQAGHPRAAELAQLEYASFIGSQALGWGQDRAALRGLHAQALGLLAQSLREPSPTPAL